MTQSIELRPATSPRLEVRPARTGQDGPGAIVAVARTDTVKLTGEAISLQQAANQSVSSGPDQAYLEPIRLAVAEGRYQVDARSTATHFIRLEYELAHP